ncbi:MAG: hypothetical protein K1W17_04160 [Oscillospiraceae bacterium]
MAKKKNIPPAPAEGITPESPAEERPEQEAPIEETAPEPSAEERPEQEAPIEETAPEPSAEEQPEQEAPIEETPCPFEATVSVGIAVLRKSIGPGTADMLKIVATLKQGTKVTVAAINNGNARLANGLWISLEYISK